MTARPFGGLRAGLAIPSPSASRLAPILKAAMLLAWAGIVIAGARYHEFWRDEVRALSLALDAPSLFSVPATVQGEGHPALWYLLLRGAYDIFGSKTVLSWVSIAVAGAAVAIFLWRAPFPLWWKALFVFSKAPLYEYSVMARNYGISMLLMFLFCHAYARDRKSALWIGAILFLLAQTNVLSALLVPFFLAIWLWDWWNRPRRESEAAAAAFVALMALAGIVLAFLTVYPPRHELITDSFTAKLSLMHAALLAVSNPGHFYIGLGHVPAALVTVMLYLSVAGLVSRPVLLASAIASLWATCLFFALVYPATGFRHLAIWFVFLIALYWIGMASGARGGVRLGPGRPFALSFFAVLPLILVINCAAGLQEIRVNLTRELSKSRAVGTLLNSTPELRNAILVVEPEHMGEAIPYYADNDIYLVRESKFGRLATWGHDTIRDLTLPELQKAAQDLHDRTGRPVVVAIQYALTEANAGKPLYAGEGWRFTYSVDDLVAFRHAARQLPLPRDALEENFDIYLID